MTAQARIRVLRAMLPAALLVFLTLVVVSLRERPSAHVLPEVTDLPNGRSGKGFQGRWLEDGKTALDARAGLLEERPGGGYHLENVERLAIARADRGPLLVEHARSADVEGPAGERRIHVRDEVVVLDPQDELRFSLPSIEFDEVAGIAESGGEVALDGPGVRGRAAGLRYDLRGGPSELREPTFEDQGGGRARAQTALLHDGVRDVELRGAVTGERGLERFSADTLHVWRTADGRPRRVESRGKSQARVRTTGDVYVDLGAASIDAEWDDAGRPSRALLDRDATLVRGDQRISADRIDVAWDTKCACFTLRAAGSAYLRATVAGAPAWLSAEKLDASADRTLALSAAHADGHVRFDSQGTRAEADAGTFDPGPNGGTIELTALEPRKARLARDRTRVAASRIRTDARGATLEAEDRVEATLLPADASGGAAVPVSGLFRGDTAVSFVARSLRSEKSGARVFLRDGVRGWQGERSLSADELDLDQAARTLSARGHVTTRIPRDSASNTVSADDFLQVTAERLDYDERRRVGVYSGRVRASFTEGWVEADRVEIALADAGGVQAIDAAGSVRIEFRAASSGTTDLHVGTGDRLEYRPAESTVRLFGDNTPASVRRVGTPTATTTGRVLRYRLDLGTLEVEPGPRTPARIRGG